MGDFLDPLREAAGRGDLDALVSQVIQVAPELGGREFTGRSPRGRRRLAEFVADLPEPLRVPAVVELYERGRAIDSIEHRNAVLDKFDAMVEMLTRAELSVPEALALLDLAARCVYWPNVELTAFAAVVVDAGQALPGEVIAVLRRSAGVEYTVGRPEARALLARIDLPPVNPGEAWADAVLAQLPALGERWRAILAHAATATSAKPTAKWEKRAYELLDGVDAAATLRGWFARVGAPRSFPLYELRYYLTPSELLDPINTTVLRGLMWLAALLPEDAATARELGSIVDIALRRVPGLGPRNPKTANAAVYALSRMPGEAALAQLARLVVRVTYKGTLKELNAALESRAAALGMTREEVEELAVPAYGLSTVGSRVDAFGEASAELLVTGTATSIQWRNAAGRPVKAPPAAVKAEHGEQLAGLRAAAKDIQQMLSAQSERLDRQFLAQRVWPYPAWRERYLDHPLVGTLARRLIWLVGEVPAAYVDGALRTVGGEPAPTAGEVRLWHPIGRAVEEVLAWREWLEGHGVTQPFKQAHREVYLLTGAEVRTGVYSNRFAAHILRQHQFHALAAARGWRNPLRLMVDDTYPPPLRELPGWGLRAEFWVDGVGEDYLTDVTESGAYRHIATDQLRFYPLDAPPHHAHASGGGYGPRHTDPVPLPGIPPLVLSEVMRDVDLFVGVASVGNDPTWQDGGPEGRYRDYWQAYSFGELNATAQTRRDLLARLLPRLAIADRASLDDRYLVIRGDLNTYKIHLGSGNILTSPANRYICIVPKQLRDKAGPLFLPFEGDTTLTLILSKALLLTRDTHITDPTITPQLR